MANEYRIVNDILRIGALKLYSKAAKPKPVSRKNEYTKVEQEEIISMSILPGNALSSLGTPVFSDCKLKVDEEDEGLYFDTILFTVSQNKNMVRTTVQGRNGDVLEYINDSNFLVNMQGLVVNNGSRNYPLDKMYKFVELMKIPNSLVIVSEYMRMLDIELIAIKDYQLTQMPGFQNIQRFEINAYSDTPINFFEDAKPV